MLTVAVIPVLKDNYSYLVIDAATRSCLIVDPPEVEPILDEIQTRALKPLAIWLTHHHQDHIAGVPGLATKFNGIPIICSERDRPRISASTRSVKEGDRLEFGGEEAFVLEVPGHAEGHVAFHFEESRHLFCGDVIFGASCGAVFGDTHSEMYHSVTRLAQLPPQTQLWCGHEYTKNNLRFAEAVLGNEALEERKQTFSVPSVPLLLETEHQTNPFMRLESREVLAYLNREAGDPEGTFKALRLAKDKF